MYKAKNMKIIIMHFKGCVGFKILFFKIKDKEFLINKFFVESKSHFFVLSYKPLCVFKHNPLISVLHHP